MSRTTLVQRQETDNGARYEWGHLFVEVKGQPGDLRQMRAGTNHKQGTVESKVVTDWLSTEHANVMSDLLRAAVVNAGGTSCGGKSLYELLWDEMDVVTDRLMADVERDVESDPDDVGGARMLAWCIAVFQNPYLPNVDSVKETAMQRWEEADRTPAPAPKKATPAARRTARRARRTS